MTTQILEPTHLSINSGREVSMESDGSGGGVPRGRSCEAIFGRGGGRMLWMRLMNRWMDGREMGKIGGRRLGTRQKRGGCCWLSLQAEKELRSSAPPFPARPPRHGSLLCFSAPSRSPSLPLRHITAMARDASSACNWPHLVALFAPHLEP